MPSLLKIVPSHFVHQTNSQQPKTLKPKLLITVCMRFRPAMDPNTHQHGQTPLHRSSTVPIPADAASSRTADIRHVAFSSRTLSPRRLLVSPAHRPRPHLLHARVPRLRHGQLVHLLHSPRPNSRVSTSNGPARLSLPPHLSKTTENAQPVVQQSATSGAASGRDTATREQSQRHQLLDTESIHGQSDRNDAEETDIGRQQRGSASSQAHPSGARAAAERSRCSAHVAAHHRRHVSDLY